jgi:hypothetical protein
MTPMRNVSFRITKYPFRFRRFWAFSTLETQRLKQIVRTARLTFEDLTLRSDAQHRVSKGGPGSEQPFFEAASRRLRTKSRR